MPRRVLRRRVVSALPWLYEVSEREHEIQNPTSPEKIRRAGELMRLGAASRVLDVACGRGGPALVLAAAFGCRIVGVEKAAVFAAAARDRIAAAGLGRLVDVHEADGAEFPLESESYDAALCLGASFVWGFVGDAAAALAPAVRSSGHVAIGEPYWIAPPTGDGGGYVGFAETVERFIAPGLALVGVVASSVDDWDRYESLHWRATEEWLAEHPGHPDAAELRAEHERARDRYVREERERLGWAILVGRKP